MTGENYIIRSFFFCVKMWNCNEVGWKVRLWRADIFVTLLKEQTMTVLRQGTKVPLTIRSKVIVITDDLSIALCGLDTLMLHRVLRNEDNVAWQKNCVQWSNILKFWFYMS